MNFRISQEQVISSAPVQVHIINNEEVIAGVEKILKERSGHIRFENNK